VPSCPVSYLYFTRGSYNFIMSEWIGKTLGRVRIESLLARGGMAEVYLGTHTTLQREVAVKILRNQYEDDPLLLERFEREARVVAKLRHPNIVQVFDFDTIDDRPYLVMEYIPGPSLSKYLMALQAKNGRLALPLVSRLLTGVANALQYAHESGVIHRDVKPGNILLTSRSSQIVLGEPLPMDFEPVLTDFGLVRFLNSSRQTSAGQTAGTPAYMSPEQAVGKTTDGRTDIYSLGIVLYELLSGNVPFDGETTMSVLLKHLNEPPASIPGLTPALQMSLDRALAKEPADRFQNPDEFATAFNTALEETSSASTLATASAVLDPTPAKKITRPTKLRKYWRQATLAGALIIFVGASFLLNGISPIVNETPTTSPATNTAVESVPLSLGPTGVLHFQDGTAILDQATLTAQAMPAPPAGSHYEVWLVGGGERRSLGVLLVDGNGRGILTFDKSQGENLLAVYNQVEIIIKPDPDSDPNVLERVAYSYTLPGDGLVYLRRLLVLFPTTPKQVALIQGLTTQAKLIDKTAREMLDHYENNDEAGTREKAESLFNLLVGAQNSEYKDWNGDGQITDPGDGYGLLLNGDNLGYIQAVYSHADYAVNSAGASRNMIVNGENVKVCIQHLARWTPELRDRILTILNAPSLSDMDAGVRDSVTLADQMLNGIDVDGNEEIEPLSGGCGVLTAYEFAYHMADMPLLPVNLLDTPTALPETVTPSQTARPTIIISPTRISDQSPNTSVPAPATHRPRPTQRPRPTKRNP
jgi:serine/threonine protein kinase